MKAFDFDDHGQDDATLWRLMGRAREVEPSPYFTRKVLRAVEGGHCSRSGWWESFLRLAAPVGVCAGLAIFAIAAIQGRSSSAAVSGAEIEFETIQNLDLLVSNYESSLWLDPSSSPSY